jgi:hypothetical protein
MPIVLHYNFDIELACPQLVARGIWCVFQMRGACGLDSIHATILESI